MAWVISLRSSSSSRASGRTWCSGRWLGVARRVSAAWARLPILDDVQHLHQDLWTRAHSGPTPGLAALDPQLPQELPPRAAAYRSRLSLRRVRWRVEELE